MTLAWERLQGPLLGGSGGERLQGPGYGSAFGDLCPGAPVGTLAQLLCHCKKWTVVVGVEGVYTAGWNDCERYRRHLIASGSSTCVAN